MANSYSSPGVYTQELDFSLVVARLSTAIYGIVGAATRGNVGELTQLGSADALFTQYGSPAPSLAVDADGVHIGGTQALYQGDHFFKNGSIVYFSRVAGTNLAYASLTLDDNGTYYAGGTDCLTLTAITPGTWANDDLAIQISDADTTATPKTYTLSVFWQGNKVETYKLLNQSTVESAINGVSNYITADVLDLDFIPGDTLDAVTARANYSALGGGDDGLYASKYILDSTGANTIKITGIREGVLCNAQSPVTSGFYVKLEAEVIGPLTYNKIGAYYNGTLIPGEEFITLVTGITVAEAKSRLITAVNAESSFYNLSDANASALAPVVGTYGLSGGLTNADIIGTKTGNVYTGLQYFRDENLNINLISAPGMYHTSVVSELIDISESRQTSLSIVSTPFDLTVAEITDWTNGAYTEDAEVPYPPIASLNSSYGTLIYQWIRTYDSYNDCSVWNSSEGAFASMMANTDNVAEPWYAPAGQRRAKPAWIEDITYSPNQSEREILYGNPGTGQNICNYWRNKRGVGIYLDGQRTLQRAATALDRVNVRRLLNILKLTIIDLSERLLHDPNDSTLWNQWEMGVRPFMRTVQAKRGLYAWEVQMDANTTTPLDIDQYTAVGRIYVQPTKAVERIILQFIVTPTGVNFSEVLG